MYDNICSVDGRHSYLVKDLKKYFSEFALNKFRVYVELKHLIKILKIEKINFNENEIMKIFNDFCEEDMRIIKEYDKKGRKNKGPFQHDVKSVEVFIQEKLEEKNLKNINYFVHIGLTSEDVNNIAYNLMLKKGIKERWLNELYKLGDKLKELIEANKEKIMLSMTHGQPASPTTFGKELAVFLKRISNEIEILKKIKLSSKLNGSVGNYNSFLMIKKIDWIKYSKELIEEIGFEFESLTNQRGPKERIIEMFQCIIRINNIIKDMDIDLWLYCMRGIISQKKIETEVGSSVMPHKINPWKLERSEGNIKLSNALLELFCKEINISRMQRDLSDSSLERNYGLAIAYSFIAIKSSLEFLNRLIVDEKKMKKELKENAQILSEAYQTILRKHGYEEAYFILKKLIRGKKVKEEEIKEDLKKLEINKEIIKELEEIDIFNYIGEVKKLCEIAIKNYEKIKKL